MNPTAISISIRYSKPMPDGSHKTVELGVEGGVDPGESWKEVQLNLYRELGNQIKVVFQSNGNGGTNGKAHAEIPPVRETVPAQTVTTREHWCTTHQADYQRYTKGNKTWYSHRGPGGAWCKEPNK